MAGRNLLDDDAPSSAGKNLLADEPKESTGHKVARRVFDYGVTPALEAGGALLGGTLGGAAGGPFGAAGGGALGYATGAELAETWRQAAGLSKPKTLKENLGRTGGELLTGVEMEMGGGIIGKGLSFIPKGVRSAADILKARKGTEATNLAEALRTKMGGRAEDVVKAAEAEKAAAQARGEKVTEATQKLEAGKPTTAARQATREKRVADSLDAIAPKPTRPTLPEDVGSVIQSQGSKNIDKLRQTRQTEAITKVKDPAFERARQREARGESISTDPKSATQFENTIKEIETQIERTPEPFRSQLKQRFAAIRGSRRALTEEEQRLENFRAFNQGRPAATEAVEPMTLDQAEFMRRMLKSKDLTSVEGFPALDAVNMGKLADKLRAAMKAYEPGFATYLSKYEELSAPITKAAAGRGEALTEIELQEAEQALFSADKSAATSYYLNGSRERAQKLVNLLGGKTPELVNSLRRYVRSQVDGMSATQIKQFIDKNEGLFQVFSELRAPLERVSLAKTEAEAAAKAATERTAAATTRLGREATAAEKSAQAPESVIAQYSADLNNVRTASADKVGSLSKTLADKMRRNNLIDDASHRQILQEINNIERQYGKTAEAKRQIDLFWRKTLVYSGLGGVGVGAYYGKKLLED